MNRAGILDRLLDSLQSFRSPNVFNPWGELDPLDAAESAPRERLSRLCRHLDVSPKFILVGEAPGFKGCHSPASHL